MADVVNPINPLAEAQRLAEAGPRYKFRVPEKYRLPADPKEVVLRQITLAEERNLAAANGNGYDALRYAVVEVDGRRLSWDNGEKERFVEGCSAPVRALLMAAYKKVNTPAEDDEANFLSTMEVALS